MAIEQTRCIAYGKNRVEIGQMDSDGYIRRQGTVVLRVKNNSIYSMHDMYLGRLKDGVGKTDRGELLFTLNAT